MEHKEYIELAIKKGIQAVIDQAQKEILEEIRDYCINYNIVIDENYINTLLETYK